MNGLIVAVLVGALLLVLLIAGAALVLARRRGGRGGARHAGPGRRGAAVREVPPEGATVPDAERHPGPPPIGPPPTGPPPTGHRPDGTGPLPATEPPTPARGGHPVEPNRTPIDTEAARSDPATKIVSLKDLHRDDPRQDGRYDTTSPGDDPGDDGMGPVTDGPPKPRDPITRPGLGQEQWPPPTEPVPPRTPRSGGPPPGEQPNPGESGWGEHTDPRTGRDPRPSG